MIGSNVDRLKHIVDDILTVAPGLRPPAPAIDPVETVMAICNDWRSTHRIASGEHGLLKIDVSGCQGPSGPGPLRVRFEPEHLQRVLVNLLDNALRYGARHVRASVPAPGVVRLDDDGRGCSAERRRDLRAALAAQDYDGGTGLGLMLADLVARAHGGSVSLPDVDSGFAVALHLGDGGSR